MPPARLPVSVGTAVAAVVAALLLATLAPRQACAKRELNIVPIAGGDSDVGIGFGEVSDLSSLDPESADSSTPYHWRVETDAFITFKLRDGDALIIPFQDYFLQLTLPKVGPGGRLRLDIRPAFTN